MRNFIFATTLAAALASNLGSFPGVFGNRLAQAQDDLFDDTTAEGMLPEPGEIAPSEGADGVLPPVEDLDDAGDVPSIGEDSVEMGPGLGELEAGDAPTVGEDSVETW